MDIYQQAGISAYNKAAAKMPQASNVVILYDGVLRHLSNARTAYNEDRKSDMFKAINKANNILLELQRTLRSDLSKPLFDKLNGFYGTSMIRISQQPRKQFEDQQFRSLLSAVRSVRDAWAEVAGMAVRGNLSKNVQAAFEVKPIKIMG